MYCLAYLLWSIPSVDWAGALADDNCVRVLMQAVLVQSPQSFRWWDIPAVQVFLDLIMLECGPMSRGTLVGKRSTVTLRTMDRKLISNHWYLSWYCGCRKQSGVLVGLGHMFHILALYNHLHVGSIMALVYVLEQTMLLTQYTWYENNVIYWRKFKSLYFFFGGGRLSMCIKQLYWSTGISIWMSTFLFLKHDKKCTQLWEQEGIKITKEV